MILTQKMVMLTLLLKSNNLKPYNFSAGPAMLEAGVDALISFMSDFENKHG